LIQEKASEFNTVVSVELKDCYSAAADRGTSSEYRPFPPEVHLPVVAARVKQLNDSARPRVHARQIRSFVEIAVMARPCQIIGVSAATVLSGDDMFDVKGVVGIVVLM
jgi:hypothetical protein